MGNVIIKRPRAKSFRGHTYVGPFFNPFAIKCLQKASVTICLQMSYKPFIGTSLRQIRPQVLSWHILTNSQGWGEGGYSVNLLPKEGPHRERESRMQVSYYVSPARGWSISPWLFARAGDCHPWTAGFFFTPPPAWHRVRGAGAAGSAAPD